MKKERRGGKGKQNRKKERQRGDKMKGQKARGEDKIKEEGGEGTTED